MRRWFRPRSRCFRVLLGMALLAWTAFAFDVFAHPLMLGAAPSSQASATTAGMASPSDGMPAMVMSNTSHDLVPAQPVGNGHGCCQNGHCYCASFCSGIAGAPSMAATIEPPESPTFTPVSGGPLPTRFTLLLRPPIA